MSLLSWSLLSRYSNDINSVSNNLATNFVFPRISPGDTIQVHKKYHKEITQHTQLASHKRNIVVLTQGSLLDTNCHYDNHTSWSTNCHVSLYSPEL